MNVDFFITNDIKLNDICNKKGIEGLLVENL